MIVQLDALERQLLAHEGLRLKPYDDKTGKEIILPTGGKITIGIGHNLTDIGITREQASILLREDIATVLAEVTKAFPWFQALDWTRQAVLLDMAFNMGVPRLKSFAQALTAMRRGDFPRAAVEMLSSRWAEQVGNRALTLAHMMETGINPFNPE